MQALEIAKGIYSVGVKDWNVRDFHGYSTYRGTTYNAFLVVDEQVVLIDTVKNEFLDQLMLNISQIIDPRKIDCVISNHTELDHSGTLPRFMHRIGEKKPVYCSRMGAKNLAMHHGSHLNYQAVESGAEMNIGKRTFQFLETRMLHWPDSMFSYLKEEKILFSSDAFGQHYSGHENFDDEIGEAVMPHARKYFANILLPYAPLILKLVDQVTALGLDIRMICPDHGIIWREDPAKIIGAYVEWSRQEPGKKAVVVYDTMWQSTRKMAEAIVAGLAAEGIPAEPMHLRNMHRSDVMTAVLDAKAVIVGSPTLNNGVFPTVSDFLTYMKGLKPQNKIGGAFGSYGWSGEATKVIRKELAEMKFDLTEPDLRIQYVPDQAAIESCMAYGRKIAERIKAG